MSEEITVEEKASAQGWVPQEEYTGDPSRWKTAEEFVEVGQKIAAVQTDRNEKLVRDIELLKREIRENHASSRKEIEAVKIDSYNRAIMELKKQQVEAVQIGDVEEFQKIQAEIDRTEKPVAKVEKEPDGPSPEYMDWAARNNWYGTNEDASIYADALGARLEKSGQYDTQKALLVAVEKKVKEVFPELGGKKKVSDVESSQGAADSGKGGKNSYATLPADAKAACDKYVKQGLYKTREDYVKEYYS
jgi:hypothetical protein